MTLENHKQISSLLICIAATEIAAVSVLCYIEPREGLTFGEAACILVIVSFFAACVGLVAWILLQLLARPKS